MYYSPVRHSVNPASWAFLVRLACIRHAASVYPEPGSNSSFDLCSPDCLLIRISYKLIDVVCVLIFLFSFQRSVLTSSQKQLVYLTSSVYFVNNFFLFANLIHDHFLMPEPLLKKLHDITFSYASLSTGFLHSCISSRKKNTA